MIDLHELANMPGAGKANKIVKAMGFWNETIDDKERIDWLAENAKGVIRSGHMQSWTIQIDSEDYDPDIMRADIDNYSSAHTQRLYAAHMEEK